MNCWLIQEGTKRDKDDKQKAMLNVFMCLDKVTTRPVHTQFLYLDGERKGKSTSNLMFNITNELTT